MIIARLQGGLGNQMFQYAAALRAAVKNGVEVKVDASLYDTAQAGITPRKFELSCFAADIRFATQDEVKILRDEKEIKSRLVRAFRRRLGLARKGFFIRERHFHFDKRVLAAPRDAYLEGYFASEKYFIDAEDAVRRDLSFREPLAGRNAVLASEMMEGASVSVHVRRGDYVSDKKTNEFHGACGAPYYTAAIEHISQKIKEPHFFIFSDDIEWARANISVGPSATYIDHNKGGEAYKDMQLMSICRHHIIANSSFSWWGSWLDARPEKLVIAPAQWFADLSVNTKDVIPASWIRL